MPIYNGIEFIEESVGSIKAQTMTDWELIIGINGHEKNSRVYQIAKVYENEKIKVLELETSGKPASLNEMILHCKYDWIALLDVDDLWHPEKLMEQIKYTNYDVIGTQCQYFGDSNFTPHIPFGDITKFNFKTVNPIINSSVLLRKELAFWNVILKAMEDYELWLRLNKQGKTFYNISNILTYHRIHTNSYFNTKQHDPSEITRMYP